MDMYTNWTGERLETFITNETMLEHLHRYAIAIDFIKGKKVLDIACGEGYGVKLLAQQADFVTGIDIDLTTIEKAKLKYISSNITFKRGSVLSIPIENHSFDVITCFETIEHLSQQELMIRELKRVLVPGGLLIISTPDKLNYSNKQNSKNPFHQKELYGEEFKTLINSHFKHAYFYKQESFNCSVVQKENINNLKNIFTGSYSKIMKSSSITPIYWIAIASDNEFHTDSSSIFHSQKSISQMFLEKEEAVKNTITYRLGHILLSPFKFIRSIIKK